MAAAAVGLIGCGNISGIYLQNARLFSGFDIVACADLNPAAAQKAADKHGSVEAVSIEALLARSDIELVINLTIPAAHCEVSCSILEAGKHAYSEKPLALSMREAGRIAELAAKKGLAVGCAPDTHMGPAAQSARSAIDSGAIGAVFSGSAHVMSAGMEMWHPDPDFFFKPGAGPVFDVGIYYITTLVSLLGPVSSVAAVAGSAQPERTISSEPRAGEKIKVETPTTVLATLEFASGALLSLGASWDVCAHRHGPIELYGAKGSIFVPDPNFFGGEVAVAGRDGAEQIAKDDGNPLGVPNFGTPGSEEHANYRAVGVADMIDALAAGREPRCSLRMAMHSLEVMEGILAAAEQGKSIRMQTSCDRPAPFGADDARALLAG